MFRGEDIRTVGSGGIGATNVYRAYGARLGIPVIALDCAKGFVPAFVGYHQVSALCGIVAGGAAMAGHWRALFLRFEKGGKMVATAGGVFFGVAVLVALGASVVWLVVFGVTRYASVASIAASVSLPVWSILLGYPPSVLALSCVTCVTVVFLHRANLRRLRSGTEHRVHLRPRRAAPQ